MWCVHEYPLILVIPNRAPSSVRNLLSLDLRYVTHYEDVIRSIRHKGLKRLYEEDDPRGVIAEHAPKLRDILARLDAAGTVADMDFPASGYIRLKATSEAFGP